MKPVILFSFLITLIACNSGADKSAIIDSTEVTSDTVTTYSGLDSSVEFLDTFSNNIVPWLQQTTKTNTANLKGLRYAENWVEDSLILSKQDVTKDFLKTYESVIVYSPDKSKILDLGSYGDADTEVAVVDLTAKKRRRVLFFGPGTTADHGYWLNDSTVLVTGVRAEQDATIPMLWKIDLHDKSNLITRYEFSLR